MADGELIIDDYKLINLIASGSASQVWEVSEQGGTGSMAMKLLLPEALADSEQRQTLKHEFKVGKTLGHPCFLGYHNLVVNKQHAYIVMDYFRAPSLKSQINSDRMSLQERFRKLVESSCLALGYMHEQGWLHRDIKPENILFNKSSELKLIDFSLSSRIASGLGKLLSGKLKVIQGTRTYIAPETLLKKQPTTQTDMYSLGITFYECLTGQPPFKGSSPADLLKKHVGEKPVPPSDYNHNVTPDTDAFILRLLAKKPEKRPRDMNEVAAEFRSLKLFHEEIADLRERLEREREAAEKQQIQDLATRLDSRTDHARTELARETGQPLPPVQKPKPRPKPAPAPPKATTPPPTAPQQPAAQMPPGQYPGMMPPGYGMPGQPYPGMPPGYGYPMGYPPGQPMPGQPMPGQPMPGQYAQYPPGQQMPYPMPPQQPGQGMPYPPGQMPPGMPPQQPAQPPRQQPSPQPSQPQAAPGSQPPAQPPAEPPRPSAPTPAKPATQDELVPGHGPLRDVRRQPKLHPSQTDADDDLPTMDELPDVI